MSGSDSDSSDKTDCKYQMDDKDFKTSYSRPKLSQEQPDHFVRKLSLSKNNVYLTEGKFGVLANGTKNDSVQALKEEMC